MSVSKSGEQASMQDRVVAINRVAKVVKGGRRFSFSALVVVGDGVSKVGYGVGKAGEVPDAIQKASEQAKKNMVEVAHIDGTLPFEISGKFGSTRVIMHPAKTGKGIIAGGAVRTIVELGGVKDIVCKIHGSKNAHTVVRATVEGLSRMQLPEAYAARRGLSEDQAIQKRHVAGPPAAGAVTKGSHESV